VREPDFPSQLLVPMQVFLAIGSEGTIYWQAPRTSLHASISGRVWTRCVPRNPSMQADILTVRRNPDVELGRLDPIDPRHFGAVELIATNVGPGRTEADQFAGIAIERYTRSPATPALDEDIRQVSVSTESKHLSAPASDGSAWFVASERGFARSADGRRFASVVEGGMPQAPFGIGGTPGAIWVWSMAPESRRSSRTDFATLQPCETIDFSAAFSHLPRCSRWRSTRSQPLAPRSKSARKMAPSSTSDRWSSDSRSIRKCSSFRAGQSSSALRQTASLVFVGRRRTASLV
jgi:hypothetical protein